VFEPYKDAKVELLGPKLLFIALNLGGMALGVWKVIYVVILCLDSKMSEIAHKLSAPFLSLCELNCLYLHNLS
jgi:hypothetical protein